MEKLSAYLKIGEEARILDVSQNRLGAWVEEERLPMYRSRANGCRMFRRADLEGSLRQAAEPVRLVKRTEAK